ncbi:MAG: YCF48-related protein [Bacteroidia bacterium]|nr:YCF48-related protein [Bacteroidia bacterium]
MQKITLFIFCFSGMFFHSFLFHQANILGQEWMIQPGIVAQSLYSMKFINSTNGWAVGMTGNIIKYNGTNWISQVSGIINDLNSVSFVDTLNGWVAGNDGLIIHTTDGGNNWIAQSSGVTKDLLSVNMISADNGWAVRKTGTTLHYTNSIWTLHNFVSYDLSAVKFTSDSSGWIAGGANRIYHYNGSEWNLVNGIPDALLLERFFLTDDTHIWAAGTNSLFGVVCKYDGYSWTDVLCGGTNNIPKSVFFTDNLNGWAVGYEGLIAHSTNGGESWTILQPITNQSIYSVSFINENLGWAVGSSGMILKYSLPDNVPQLMNENELSVIYNDIQKYLTVHYKIVQPCLLKYNIYDYSGKVVLSSIHKQQTPGLYERIINTGDLLPGLYIYMVTSDKASRSGKIMVR